MGWSFGGIENPAATVFLLLLVQLLLVRKSSVVDAVCTESDGPCLPDSGSCSEAVVKAVLGNLEDAIISLSYGKYCGGTNKCRPITSLMDDLVYEEPEENLCLVESKGTKKSKKKSKKSKVKSGKKEEKGGKKKHALRGIRELKSSGGNRPSIEVMDPCPVDSCNDIDESCKVHDACLDALIAEHPTGFDGRRIPTPERCECDVPYVFELANIAIAGAEPTGLCDDAFYNQEIPEIGGHTAIEFLGSEATLLAAPFCCDLLRDSDNDGKTDCFKSDAIPDQVLLATSFCEAFIESLGLPLCQQEPA